MRLRQPWCKGDARERAELLSELAGSWGREAVEYAEAGAVGAVGAAEAAAREAAHAARRAVAWGAKADAPDGWRPRRGRRFRAEVSARRAVATELNSGGCYLQPEPGR